MTPNEPLILSSTVTLMGILNISPESFSDGGKFSDIPGAVKGYDDLLNAGAGLVDVGGLATGPGSTLLPEEIELQRVDGFLEALLDQRGVDALSKLSVDTFRSVVAERALIKGVRVINDISGLRFDKRLGSLVAEYGAEIVLMYSKEDGQHPLVTDRPGPNIPLLTAISDFFDERIDYALRVGINQSRIILDTGLGAFISPAPEKSWELLRLLPTIIKKYSEFRFLIGASRKGFIGVPLSFRDIHSKIIELYLINAGVSIIRTHNVRMLSELLPTWNNLN